MESHTRYSTHRRVFARYRTHTRVEYGKRYSSFEYFESSMESGTQAMSMLSRVWKAVLKL